MDTPINAFKASFRTDKGLIRLIERKTGHSSYASKQRLSPFQQRMIDGAYTSWVQRGMCMFIFGIKPLTVVAQKSNPKALGVVLSIQKGWAEVIQPQLQGGGVEYRTETFITEVLKPIQTRSTEPIAQVLLQLAPLLLERHQLNHERLALAPQQERIQELLPLMKASSHLAGQYSLYQRAAEQTAKVAHEIAETISAIDSYVHQALLHAQLQRVANDMQKLPDPIALYSQQRVIQTALQDLRLQMDALQSLYTSES